MPKPKANCWTTSPRPDAAGSKLLTEAAERMQLTARGYHRVLRVARTIADLAGAEPIAAAAYRRGAILSEIVGTELACRSPTTSGGAPNFGG